MSKSRVRASQDEYAGRASGDESSTSIPRYKVPSVELSFGDDMSMSCVLDTGTSQSLMSDTFA